ncbi:protein-disulfide reductase DsbD [Marinomonas mediterranea]|uniref:protein-disulfide reductase DsbD n=1 Tax=Marinomonas mediterranea TaxID=119864 RepID=UPI0023494740|nr:protein-disulfide reductase DsbD [Marinomonas mediterranea]WCN11451.1 protein-disulfide reductase DsbD [Marinomonas mediterranea]WCN15517.1 protein-disulfide reductase DsbD [Marinomonas mediterranea]
MFSLVLVGQIRRLAVSFLVMFLAVPAFSDSDFLSPTKAFQLDIDDAKREIHWNIADGYYLYESRVSVWQSDDKSVSIPFHFLTKSEQKDDPNFGLVRVFHNQMAISIDVETAKQVDLTVSYQGCAAAGLCYPPQTKQVSFNAISATNDNTDEPTRTLDSTSNSPTSTSIVKPSDSPAQTMATASNEGEEGRLVKLLLNGGSVWVLLTFFVLGLGLTFTPCVLPMIPILAGIIAGQAGNITAKKGFFLSLSYVLGMSFSYSMAGVLVGLFGAQLNLQALFQTPSVLIGFSLLFVLLSLSMFGFYELQLPVFVRDRLDKLSQKSVGGPYLGVGIMGAISALIVSPCVSAPLAGALIYISTTGDAVLGGSVLFVMSLGMGVPLLLVGLGGGKYLPKAGMWMMQVKAAFGVILLGVAVALLSRILPDTVNVYLWAGLCIVYAVHLSPFQSGENGWGKTRQGIALMLLIYGTALLTSGLAGKPSLEKPLGYVASVSNAMVMENVTPLFDRMQDVDALEEAMQQGMQQNKVMVVDLYADWCTACIEMEKSVFSNPELQIYSEKVSFLQLDLTDNTTAQQAFLTKYGAFGPPTVLFFSPDGGLVNLRQGEIDLTQFKQVLQSTRESF